MTGTATTDKPVYAGRFAPSPTGPLHFGSLLAAAASYYQARAGNARWFVRMEDIDPPRMQPGAADAILRALERYGFEWDGAVRYQSRSDAAHREALRQLLDNGHAYHCGCSRRTLAHAPQGPLGVIYPGTCRNGSEAEVTAVRVLTNDAPIGFVDGLQGAQSQRLQSESGDFVVWRKDNLVAYHLAVVVDDHRDGITEVVRGMDLLDSTPRQIWLQQLLGYAMPRYCHIPLAVHADGAKLSKLTNAPAVPMDDPLPTLLQALTALLQQPPPPQVSGIHDLHAWAIAHWNPAQLAGRTQWLVQDNRVHDDT